MPYCSSCGSELAAEVNYCPSCGSATSNSASHERPAGTEVSGLSENVAGLLCYVLGWLSGLVFFLLDKRPYVRFHAMQSILTFGSIHLLQVVLVAGGVWGGMMGAFMGGISWLVFSTFQVMVVVVWIVCMVKAYQGSRIKLPLVGELAENYSK